MAPGTPVPDSSWVAVALILRPHGLAGVMRLKPLTRTADEFIEAPVRKFRVRQGKRITTSLELEEAWEASGVLHARFRGITDRTAAEALTGGELVIPEGELWESGPDSYYIHHLEGLEVRAADGGGVLGRVLTAREGAAHDYLVIKLNGIAARETLLPLIPQFVPTVDVKAGFVEVRIPDGLLDAQ